MASANNYGVIHRLGKAGHAADRWSKQENSSAEESKEMSRKKPLKNGFRVLYLSLTAGQIYFGSGGHGRNYK
jgi:hypothetical protein